MDTQTWVYFIGGGDFVKIGIAKDPRQRLKELQVGCPIKLEIISMFQGGRKTEQLLHKRFAHLRCRGEWFKAEPELLEFARHSSYDRFTNITWGNGYFAVVDSGSLKAPAEKEHYFTVLICDDGKNFVSAAFLPGGHWSALHDGVEMIVHEGRAYLPLEYLERETNLNFGVVRKLIEKNRSRIEELKRSSVPEASQE